MSLIAPRVGEKFEYRFGNNAELTGFRCDGYLRMVERKSNRDTVADSILEDILCEEEKKKGMSKLRMQWTDRAHAEFVTGCGVCGCVAPLQKVKRSYKMVPWSREHIDEERENSWRRNGEPCWGMSSEGYEKDRPSLWRRAVRFVLTLSRKF